MRFPYCIGCSILLSVFLLADPAAGLDIVEVRDAQPLVSSALRLEEALAYLGSALPEQDAARLRGLADAAAGDEQVRAVQEILDPYCLAAVHINPEARVKVQPGPAAPNLMQAGWKSFLVKVHNEGAVRSALDVTSPNAAPSLHASSGKPVPREENLITGGELDERFLEIAFYRNRPMQPALSGEPLEYQIIQIYTPRQGKLEARLGFHAGHGTEDLGMRNALTILFDSQPSVKVVLDVRDMDGETAMASFTIRDNVERFDEKYVRRDYRLGKSRRAQHQRPGIGASPLVGIYPLPSRRVADTDEYPDFFFHPQVYRATGEHVYLPPGRYDVTWTRGPEYLAQTRTITVPEGESQHTETFQLERWIHMADLGWYSGDHHVHAGGCSHYESPEAGVKPEAMMRQAQGEDLNVSCVLTWGPCWYHQKSFFEGKVHKLSTRENLMRYDVEVSGFPSSHAGHVCLLRLEEDDYPGTTKIEEWPTWTLPVMQWAKGQDGVTGYAHSGWGLEPMEETWDLPNYTMAKFDGIGANEYIVTATHGACDFISAGDTPITWELNIWYHVLNCGFRTAISGETDFPCIFDERVGMARSYAKIGRRLNFDAFVDEIRDGRVYVSDGRSHIFEMRVDGKEMGEELNLSAAGPITVSADVAAYLPETQDEAGARIVADGWGGRPYWHIEKAREADTRDVRVELVVNGQVVADQSVAADGKVNHLEYRVNIDRSSWVALRILGSAHTNPVYVTVDGAPIRASKRSAEWCRAAVDRCWEMKAPRIAEDERAAAIAAYEHARAQYDAAIAEAVDGT